MAIQQAISVGNLLLDVGNPRIVKQEHQKAARDAIIAEQGRKLVVLDEDIIAHGLNPSDLPIVFDATDGNQNFVMIEGNRRLTAIQLLLNPELAEGTPIHVAFKRLSNKHADSIPKVLMGIAVWRYGGGGLATSAGISISVCGLHGLAKYLLADIT